MFVKIGKALDNDCVIDDPHVSRHHAVLKSTTDGEYFIEDLASGNGTFVNGQQILRKKVTSADIIMLGGKYTISLSEILNCKNNYSSEFEALKEIYEKYQSQKIRIQSTNQFKTRLLQSLPFTLPGIIGVVLSIAGIANTKILYVSLAVAITGPVIGIFMGAKQAAKTPGQLQALSDQFKTDYVCPKCGTFLGEIPWQSLKNKGQCSNPSCKSNW